MGRNSLKHLSGFVNRLQVSKSAADATGSRWPEQALAHRDSQDACDNNGIASPTFVGEGRQRALVSREFIRQDSDTAHRKEAG
jgi:hypothetical protein